MAHTSVRGALLVAFGFVVFGAAQTAPSASVYGRTDRAFAASTIGQTRVTEEAMAVEGTEWAPSFAVLESDENSATDEVAEYTADDALSDEMRQGNMPEPTPPSDPASESESEGAPEDSDRPEVA